MTIVYGHDMTYATIEAIASEGYLPVAVKVEERRLVLRQMEGDSFTEPFYNQTTSQWSNRRSIDISLDGFMRIANGMPWAQPLNVICHTGRCGSTLLANLLALRDKTLVLKEPKFLNAAVLDRLNSQKEGTDEAAHDLSTTILKYLALTAWARGQQLVVKTTSWTAPKLLSMVGPAADGNWLLLWRDPIAVIASELITQPGWSSGHQIARIASLLGIKEIANDHNLVNRLAKVWCAIATSFVTAATSSLKVALLNYDDLVSDKLAALLQVESRFGIQDGMSVPIGFSETATRYSKSRTGEEFEPDHAHYRNPLAEKDRCLVEEITGPTVKALEQLMVNAQARHHHANTTRDRTQELCEKELWPDKSVPPFLDGQQGD